MLVHARTVTLGLEPVTIGAAAPPLAGAARPSGLLAHLLAQPDQRLGQ
jgi:hypothetical protein